MNPHNPGVRSRTTGGSHLHTDPVQPAPAITVVEMSLSRRPGNLKAFAAVQIGKWMRVNGFRIVWQPGQRPWASGPMQERTTPDGSVKYFPVIEMPREWQQAATDAVLQAWLRYERDGVLPGCRVIGGGR